MGALAETFVTSVDDATSDAPAASAWARAAPYLTAHTTFTAGGRDYTGVDGARLWLRSLGARFRGGGLGACDAHCCGFGAPALTLCFDAQLHLRSIATE